MNNDSTAIFSSCRKYRYELWRWWDRSKPYAVFIGLNPSTADEINNDATVTRCIRFAQSWDYGGLCMMNLFAFRATKPYVMKACLYPIGDDNDEHLIMVTDKAGVVVAAWGTHGNHKNRDKEVMAFIPNMWCLGTTKGGHPRHPLYLRKDTKLTEFSKRIGQKNIGVET